jgi:hypothetical protein
MNFKKLGVLSLFALLVTFALTSSVAAQRPDGDLSNKNWRVFNINPDVPKLWDIKQAQSLNTGGVGFTFNQLSSGWFTVYLNTNFIDLTGKTMMTADANWTTGTQYVNRAQTQEPGARFRLYFQSAQGNYNANDYWWSMVYCDLNTQSACTLSVSLADRTAWTNLCGQPADDITVYTGPNCVGGTYPGVSPYDGFTKAMRNVKDVGLSFGRPSAYASGVANAGSGPASFRLNSFGAF